MSRKSRALFALALTCSLAGTGIWLSRQPARDPADAGVGREAAVPWRESGPPPAQHTATPAVTTGTEPSMTVADLTSALASMDAKGNTAEVERLLWGHLIRRSDDAEYRQLAVNWSVLAARLGLAEARRAELSKLAAAGGVSDSILFLTAEISSLGRDWAASERAVGELTERYPHRVDLLRKRVELLTRAGKIAEALEVQKSLLDRDPANHAAHSLHYAQLQQKTGRTADSTSTLQAVITDFENGKYEASSAGLLLKVGAGLARMGAHAEAIRAYELGARLGTVKFRNERMRLESVKLKFAAKQATQEDRDTLRNLSSSARSDFVRDEAKEILSKETHQ